MTTYADWRTKYRVRLCWIDAFVVIWAASGAYFIRFRMDGTTASTQDSTSYAVLTVLLILAWWLFLSAWGSRDPKILGAGTEEYKSVFAASLWLFGLVAILSYAFQFETARGYVGLALPAGVLGLLIARWVVRQLLCAERSQGRSNSRVMIIGGPLSAEHLVRSFVSHPQAGYQPVAGYLVGVPDGALAEDITIPVIGHEQDLQKILNAIQKCQADTVAISSGAQLAPEQLRLLGWELAAKGIGMILAPALTDVAGPRIHTQPVAGLPLIHVSTPKLTGGKRVAKRLFDVVGAVLLIAFSSPMLIIIAVLVKATSPGPIFYAQSRIGKDGTPFHMIKFRSMKQNADAELQRLLEAQGTAGKPLFKVENDPRITAIGKILRKYSLDELPQLFNVLMGTMSLVGPRPQREGEVALYDHAAHRRLYVSPGMSGLWQVSGRSNLSWEQSIRIDLYYVENWSLTQDIVILLKTFRAVFGSHGAV
ncbi:sugar transferase [Arthrobacter sp. Y81]|uniref:sugar transferase n=1 Tax=Arthrobacter sp. Y81 TaxID=2058897 RepID=UPI000CE31F81|nr:sugar transferase [Arthrobacter sp. Y81]